MAGAPPNVDVVFLEEQILGSGKVIEGSKVKVGSTTSFVMIGNKPLHRRYVLIREVVVGEIGYDQAVGIAVKLGFLGTLMQWLQNTKDYKEGGYVVPKPIDNH